MTQTSSKERLEQRLTRAREVIQVEARTIQGLERVLDERFGRAIDLLLACQGKVVVTSAWARRHILHLSKLQKRSVWLWWRPH